MDKSFRLLVPVVLLRLMWARLLRGSVFTEDRAAMRFCAWAALVCGLLATQWSQLAVAGLQLSFDQSLYTIAGVGQTVQVPVYLSQVAGGPQVGVGNELLSAGITVYYNSPAGIAQVLLASDVQASPAFDSSSASVSATLATLAETSIAGISDLSNPLLLGTFKFTGLAAGSTTVITLSLGPGPSFITALGNTIDPSAGATATVSVVPEPSTLLLVCSGGVLCSAFLAALFARRNRSGD